MLVCDVSSGGSAPVPPGAIEARKDEKSNSDITDEKLVTSNVKAIQFCFRC